MQLDRAAVGRLPAGEDRQQRRLAGTVGPDQPDLLAGTHLEGDPVQDRLRPEMLGDVDNVEQDHGWRLTVKRLAGRMAEHEATIGAWPRIAERASRGRCAAMSLATTITKDAPDRVLTGDTGAGRRGPLSRLFARLALLGGPPHLHPSRASAASWSNRATATRGSRPMTFEHQP